MTQEVAKQERRELPTHPHHQSLEIIPETAGPRLATSRGGAIHSIRPPGEQAVQSGMHLAAVMLAPALSNRAALGSDRLQEYDAPAGALVIQPAGVQGRAIWSTTRESLIVAIKPDFLLELATGEFDAGGVSFQPPAFGTVDHQALHMAELLKTELTKQEPANELFVDSLVTAFGIHLLLNYTGVQKKPPSGRSGLSARSAGRVQEFLDENFTRKLSVAEIAAVSGLSPFHFIRAFTKTFGQPPHRYVLNMRLNFAEKLLSEGFASIWEIAYLSGFSSQSHLGASMKKHRNKTPTEIRRNAR